MVGSCCEGQKLSKIILKRLQKLPKISSLSVKVEFSLPCLLYLRNAKTNTKKVNTEIS